MDSKIRRPRLGVVICNAIQALESGTATPDQQKKILPYIINEICLYHDDPFVYGKRDVTEYYAGRRSAAVILMDHVKIDVNTLSEKG